MPLASSTARCFITEGSARVVGAASSLAEAGPLVQVPGLDGPASNGVLSLQTMCEGVVSWQQLEELERAGARGLMVLAVERSLA